MRKVLNSSNVLGAIAFLAMIAATGAAENPVLAVVLSGIFAGCTYLSIKEDGKKDRPHRREKLGAYQGHNNIDASIIRVQERRCQVVVSVNCDSDDCMYYREGVCGNKSISIELTPTRDFQAGERVVLRACQDYKELGDDGAD